MASGPVVYLGGTDVDRDLAGVRLEFLDANGAPVLLLDGNGDGVADLSEAFVPTAGVEATDGGYFVAVDVAQVADLSPRMAATVTDYAGLSSARLVLQRAFPPVRGEGEGCSTRGFDTCESGTRCWGTPASAQCLGISTLQGQVCTAAPALSGAGTTQGDTLPVSLWDPPTSCATGDPRGAVEGVVRLTLAAPAATLTLSTDHPGTTFDTVLTLLPSCGAGLPLGCNDDVNTALGQRRSTLVLQNVPAGDYLVVVDGFDAAGGHFVLSVGVQ